jgi:superfamily II DNA helicase RecQ
MLAEKASIIRAGTVKRNIRYRVTRMDDRNAVEEEMIRMISKLETGLTGDQKGMMYCRSKKACEELAEKLGYDFYHAEMTGEKEMRWEIFSGGRPGPEGIVG